MLQRLRQLLPKTMPLFWLALAAFWLQALIPAGFMPSRSDGSLLEICSGFAGAIEKAPARSDSPHQQNKHKAPCSYAGLGVGTLPAFNMSLAQPIALADPWHLGAAPFTISAFSRALPPARAPPVRA